ncbi:MAG: class I SAM-dependent methyltransferase [Pirellulaceae bacterium]
MYVKDGEELIRKLDEFSPQPSDYFKHGANRIAASINMLPKGSGRVLELGCDGHFSLAVAELTSYEVFPQNSPNPIAAWEGAATLTQTYTHQGGREVQFTRELFDIEQGRFPLESNTFDGVLCCEVIEHLFRDPALMLQEAHRVLKPGGWLLVTTPNLISYHTIRRAMQGVHPLECSNYFHGEQFPGYMIQHTHEYTCWELNELIRVCGFSTERIETYTFTKYEKLGFLDYALVIPATLLYSMATLRHPRFWHPKYRRPHTFILARKTGTPSERYPKILYFQN